MFMTTKQTLADTSKGILTYWRGPIN